MAVQKERETASKVASTESRGRHSGVS